MPASILQCVFNDDGGSGTGNTFTVTLTNVTAGSTIQVWVTGSTAASSVTVADPTNGAYTAVIDKITDGTATQNTWQCRHENVAHTAGNLVITATFNSSSTASRGVCAAEIGDVPTSGVLDGHTSTLQASPGAGTDAVTVGPPSPNNANEPALVVALTFDALGTSTGTPVHGTGYSSAGSGWGLGVGHNLAAVESKRVTGHSTAATFTASGGTQSYTNFVAIFDESGSSPIPSTNTLLWNDTVAE